MRKETDFVVGATTWTSTPVGDAHATESHWEPSTAASMLIRIFAARGWRRPNANRRIPECCHGNDGLCFSHWPPRGAPQGHAHPSGRPGRTAQKKNFNRLSGDGTICKFSSIIRVISSPVKNNRDNGIGIGRSLVIGCCGHQGRHVRVTSSTVSSNRSAEGIVTSSRCPPIAAQCGEWVNGDSIIGTWRNLETSPRC